MSNAVTAQSYANHARNPLPYLLLFRLMTLNVGLSGIFIVLHPGLETAWNFVLSIGLLLFVYVARTMVLTVQDRLIRLEMHLRLADILPADLKGRIGDLSLSQLIGLRFASDAELSDLVRRCLAGEFQDTSALKREIRTWRPDLLRA